MIIKVKKVSHDQQHIVDEACEFHLPCRRSSHHC